MFGIVGILVLCIEGGKGFNEYGGILFVFICGRGGVVGLFYYVLFIFNIFRSCFLNFNLIFNFIFNFKIFKNDRLWNK